MSLSESASSHLATMGDRWGSWFRSLARTLQTGVVLLDDEGNPVYANTAARELLGLPSPGDESPPGGQEDLARLEERLPGELGHEEAGKELSVEVPFGKGARSVVLRTIPIDGDCGALVLVEDRTRMVALDSSLAYASRVRTQALFRSQAHDLKAPLNALSLNLGLLQRSLEEEEDKPDETRRQQLGTIDVLQREIARLGRALDEALRDRSPQAAGGEPARPTDLRRVVRDVARLVRAAAKAQGIRVRVDVDPNPVHANVQRDRVEQALLDLVLNALEAQPDGGEVRLRAERGRGHVKVDVEDDGPGIPPELRDKVFQMNFTTKESGTGIGLTVARSLVEAQGGRLDVECPQDGGTTIHMLFAERRGEG